MSRQKTATPLMSLQLLTPRMELSLAMFHGSWQEPAGTFIGNNIAVATGAEQVVLKWWGLSVRIKGLRA